MSNVKNQPASLPVTPAKIPPDFDPALLSNGKQKAPVAPPVAPPVALSVTPLFERSLVAEGRILRVVVIINPAAGSFVIKKRFEACEKALKNAVDGSAANPRRPIIALSGKINAASGEIQGINGFFQVSKKGDTGKIIEYALETAKISGENQKDAPFNLVVTAGGDGTHREALETLYRAFLTEAYSPLKEKFAVLRLPLGTGNDGADSPSLDAALALLYRPSKITFTRGLRLTTSTAGQGPFLAFNILSLGLDAFVTHMVNKMKSLLPGDSYKLWVDIASLFYDRAFKIGPETIEAFDGAGNIVQSLRENILLLAVGASGGRTYGSQKHILPDGRNVCMVRQMPLLRKIALKDRFTAGTHIDAPECLLFNAAKITLSGGHPILAQMDGETVLLRPEDFPVRIEMTEPVIPVLSNSADLISVS